ncbi:hypothetical protein BGZ81_008377 [Podila clonocystis]|nr:hypothetical protein BGZ81_008377 [Podila clonocystis]
MTCPESLINSDPSTLYHLYNEKQGFLPAPVQNDQPSKVSKKKKSLKKFLLVVLVLLGYLVYKFLLPLYNGWPFYHRDHYHDHIINGDTCSHNTGSLLLRPDVCHANSISYDGPSTFSTTSDRFILTLGSGNMAAKVGVKTSAHVLEPTLIICGDVSPVDNGDQDIVSAALKGTTSIEHQGVNLKISEDEYSYNVQIQYHDRVLRAPSGEKYCACARLEVHVLLPESYTQYSQLIIRGETADIEIFNVDNVGFGELWFEVGVGSVFSQGNLVVDALAVDVKTGNVLIQSIMPATEGAPLAVVADVATGDVTLHAKTKPAKVEHDIQATSKTGSVKITVTPALPSFSSPWLLKPADLNIRAASVEGPVSTKVELESRAQNLHLDATSSSDLVLAILSDDFSGRFRAESLVKADVYEADKSESMITYEKQTSLVKEGVKSFSGETPQQGRVNLKSSGDLVVLEFVN